MSTKKPKRYLITAACTFPGKNMTGHPVTLTRTIYTKMYADHERDAVRVAEARTEALVQARLRLGDTDVVPCGSAVVDKRKRRAVRPISVGNASDSAWQDRAVTYARWLAARDGIVLPDDHHTHCVWDVVRNPFRLNSRGAPVMERRIRAVRFSVPDDDYVLISLPHWDFVQPPAVEQTDTPEQAAA